MSLKTSAATRNFWTNNKIRTRMLRRTHTHTHTCCKWVICASCSFRNSRKKNMYVYSPGAWSWPCGARLEPLRRRAPVGGHHWSLGATYLGSLGDWLWELVSPRIHASPPTWWSVLPAGWGSVWVCHELGNAPILRSWTGSWVLSG